jgi:hypothetical protein
MNNLKTYEQYNLNEEIDFKKHLNKLKMLGLALLVTVVSCERPENLNFRGTGVVTSISKESNVITPKLITVNTPVGEFELTPSNANSITRTPFSVSRGDTIYISINPNNSNLDYIAKIEKGQQKQNTEIYKSLKLKGEESNW